MFDFRLQVFYTAAKRLNFTKAAAELFITQPAVTKHIHELEHHFKTKLFERSNNALLLTPAGETLLQHTELLITAYNTMEFEMSNLVNIHSGKLKLGASTTVAQYVIPPVLAAFHKKFTNIEVTLINNNTEQIELSLLNKEIELGIIEGRSKNKAIRYTPFLEDEIVLVSNLSHPLAQKESIRPEDLRNIPLLLREPGSGTLEVIAHALKPFHIKLSQLKVEMQLGSTESIKSYLLHSSCMTFVSIHSILKELRNNECRIIDVKGLSVKRPFYFIQAQGQIDALPGLFTRFAKHYNLK